MTAQASGWKNYVNSLIAEEISSLTRYYDALLQWKRRPDDTGNVFARIEVKERRDLSTLPDLSHETTSRTAVLLHGTFNHHLDIQGLLSELKPKLARTSRVIAVLYNPYLSFLYRLANQLGLRKGEQPTTFITHTDLDDLTRLTGYEVVRNRAAVYVPGRFLGVGTFLNRVLPAIPFLRVFSLVNIVVLRPVISSRALPRMPSLTVVIPARNESGNIQNAITRMPDLGCEIEVIFVEGNSTDDTWAEIQRVVQGYSGPLKLKALQQKGKGKSDAVRTGFAAASGELLTILDADLTMPPERLSRFYNAYVDGLADFVNGTRLMYPMEGDAMRFLNRLGNVFFAKALSIAMQNRISDSLCGTKLVARHDYQRMVAWRKDFGDFDPFGDFELLFPAAILGLGIIDIPIRYAARTYGTTNIRRFRDGWTLLKMTTTGFLRIRLGKIRK